MTLPLALDVQLVSKIQSLPFLLSLWELVCQVRGADVGFVNSAVFSVFIEDILQLASVVAAIFVAF